MQNFLNYFKRFGGYIGFLFGAVIQLHNLVFAAVQRFTENWLLGAAARFTFASVLFTYYFDAAVKKLGTREGGKVEIQGIGDFFTVNDSAYYTILTEPRVAQFDYDISKMPFLDHVIVYLGSYGEFILPILLVIGLFTRIAAIGMIMVVVVQSYVDVVAHGAAFDTKFMFDATTISPIVDQRLLWLFPLIYLALRGGGALSIDYIFGRIGRSRVS